MMRRSMRELIFLTAVMRLNVVMSLEVNNNMLPCRSRDDDKQITLEKSDNDAALYVNFF